MHSDYRAIPALDRYDPDMLDESEISQISETDRQAAEHMMRKRDREEGIDVGRMRRGLLYGMLIKVCFEVKCDL